MAGAFCNLNIAYYIFLTLAQLNDPICFGFTCNLELFTVQCCELRLEMLF